MVVTGGVEPPWSSLWAKRIPALPCHRLKLARQVVFETTTSTSGGLRSGPLSYWRMSGREREARTPISPDFESGAYSNSAISRIVLVGGEGLEPSRQRHWFLRPARLPIPPTSRKPLRRMPLRSMACRTCTPRCGDARHPAIGWPPHRVAALLSLLLSSGVPRRAPGTRILRCSLYANAGTEKYRGCPPRDWQARKASNPHLPVLETGALPIELLT